MKFLSQKLSFSRGIVGVCQGQDGLAVAHVLQQGDNAPRLNACDFLSGGVGEQASLLQGWLKKVGLSATRAVFSLAVDDYQMLQVAPPEVPDNELRDAIRWQIRDLVDYSIEEAVVDVFQVPRDTQREGARTAYVVVARQNLLRQKIALLKDTKLKLQVIDIPELVLRNIGNLLPHADRGVALLCFGPDSGQMIVCRAGKLCLARTINVGAEALRPGAPYWQDMFDSVALEVQRSLDFFESNFSQPAINTLVLAPLGFPSTDLMASLGETLGLTVQPLEIAQLLDCQMLPDRPEQCLLAIGAALRTEMASS
ncbi:MAG: pilus assembly protein PilM [Desulfuromonadaceae bacterium]|nr:pilus assembly protein PilM [Desulfuromonadaceae bacterium]